MADPFLAEIRPFPFNFAPVGWAMCQGQLLAISQNTALFSLLGTQYGGNGTSNFALPNLQGCVPIGQGFSIAGNYNVGGTGGTDNVTLQPSQMATHSHSMAAFASSATATSPANAAPGEGHGGGRGGTFSLNAYTSQTPTVTLAPGAVGPAGAGQAHNNMQPSLVVNWCIALQGIYPPRS
jgi:microcystin-dependent protein